MSTPNNAPLPSASGDADLARKLATVAHPHLKRVDADCIYAALGIGETFTAIHALIAGVVRNQIPLSADLAATLVTWLDGYVGQIADPRLRALLAGIKTDMPQQITCGNEQAGNGPVVQDVQCG